MMLVGTAPMVGATAASKLELGRRHQAEKAKPDALSFGTIGNGSLGHLTMTRAAGAPEAGARSIQGGGPMITDAVGGQIDWASPRSGDLRTSGWQAARPWR